MLRYLIILVQTCGSYAWSYLVLERFRTRFVFYRDELIKKYIC